MRALMTQKSCAVGMRNAKLRDHFKMRRLFEGLPPPQAFPSSALGGMKLLRPQSPIILGKAGAKGVMGRKERRTPSLPFPSLLSLPLSLIINSNILKIIDRERLGTRQFEGGVYSGEAFIANLVKTTVSLLSR